MSLIGPRPERPFFTKKYLNEIPYYLERMRNVKPGLTGLAQITLGYDKSLQTVTHKYYYDLSYRFCLSSFSSWVRVESWVFLNTVRYLLNQVQLTHLLKNLILWKKFQLAAESVIDKGAPETIHIAHPWKLIDKISKKSGQKLPSFIDEFNDSRNAVR
jgi:hypothetical protein